MTSERWHRRCATRNCDTVQLNRRQAINTDDHAGLVQSHHRTPPAPGTRLLSRALRIGIRRRCGDRLHTQGGPMHRSSSLRTVRRVAHRTAPLVDLFRITRISGDSGRGNSDLSRVGIGPARRSFGMGGSADRTLADRPARHGRGLSPSPRATATRTRRSRPDGLDVHEQRAVAFVDDAHQANRRANEQLAHASRVRNHRALHLKASNTVRLTEPCAASGTLLRSNTPLRSEAPPNWVDVGERHPILIHPGSPANSRT